MKTPAAVISMTVSSPQEKDWVLGQLLDFNRQTLSLTPEAYSTPLNFHLRASDGRIVAGINATMLARSSVYVAILWVDPACRGENHGSTLLRHVEDEARQRGGQMVHLDTFDFQAKDFYLKLGYEIYAKLEDSPSAGHTRYYLSKRL